LLVEVHLHSGGLSARETVSARRHFPLDQRLFNVCYAPLNVRLLRPLSSYMYAWTSKKLTAVTVFFYSSHQAGCRFVDPPPLVSASHNPRLPDRVAA
jgi:hypothetical protein